MSWIDLVAQRRPPQAPEGVTPPDNAADWYRIENSADDADATDIFVYDSVGGWFGLYAEDFIRDLKAVATSRINLRINSPGGSVFEGVAIANALRAHPANVTCYVDSLAASIASVIALSGDRLVMQPQSMLMIHDASGGCQGNAKDMQDMADLLGKVSDNIAGAYAAKAGGTREDWRATMQAETWYTAEEAVEAGLADEAAPMPKKDDDDATCRTSIAERMRASWDLTMFRYAGRENAPTPLADAVLAAGAAVAEGITKGLQGDPGDTTPAHTITRIVDIQDQFGETFAAQFKSLMREAIHDEIAHIFDAVAPAHSTAVEDGTWDAGANEKRLPSPIPVATVKKMYTYWDAEKVEDGAVPKASAKLPHHFVSEDGSPGAASVAGVRNALARLPQTQGLSEAERSAAESHLRKHLNAFKDDSEDHAHDDVTDEGAGVHTVDHPQDPPPETPTAPPEEAPPPEDTPPAEGAPAAQADDWKQLVGFFHAPTSSSADDVFARLKEEW